MKLQFSALALAVTWALSKADDQIELVEDIFPGAASSNPIGLTRFDGKVYFAATGQDSGVELYVSDGEMDGTMLLQDINQGSGSSNPSGFTVFDNKLFFRAKDDDNGEELWVTDGTVDGTTLFLDINPGAASSSPADFVVLGDLMIFGATTEAAGKELWVTNGTVAGTQLLQDIQAGPNGSDLFLRSENTINRDTLVFAADDGINGRSLYSTNGTEAGTIFLNDVSPEGEDSSSSIIGLSKDRIVSKIHFTVGTNLWVTDGTVAGTSILATDIDIGGPSRIASYSLAGKTYFFSRNTALTADDLWETNGTPAGTKVVVTGLEAVQSARGSSSVFGLGFGPVIGGKISLLTDNGVGVNLWVFDGTDIELLIDDAFEWVLDVKPSLDGKQAVFLMKNGTSMDLWTSNYTPENTNFLHSFPGGISSNVGESVALNNKESLFTAGSAEYGVELWKMEFPELVGSPTLAPNSSPTTAPNGSPTNPTTPAPVPGPVSNGPTSAASVMSLSAVVASMASAFLLVIVA